MIELIYVIVSIKIIEVVTEWDGMICISGCGYGS